MNDFLPYYRYFSDRLPRPSQTLLNVTHRGHDMWSSDNVAMQPRNKNGDQIFYVYYLKLVPVISMASESLAHTPSSVKDEAKKHIVNFTRGNCTCTGFEQTGKYCSHLWASQWHVSNGPIHEWEGTCLLSDMVQQYKPDLSPFSGRRS